MPRLPKRQTWHSRAGVLQVALTIEFKQLITLEPIIVVYYFGSIISFEIKKFLQLSFNSRKILLQNFFR